MGWQLGAALENDYILIYGGNHTDNGNHLLDTSCRFDCGSAEDMECIFQPISSCSYLDNIDDKAPDVNLINPWVNANIPHNRFRPQDCPTIWKEKLTELHRGLDLTDTYYKKWWRTQSAAYLGRLNSMSLREIRDLRLSKSDHSEYFWDASSERVQITPTLFPLPAGTTSVHMRHRDTKSGRSTALVKK